MWFRQDIHILWSLVTLTITSASILDSISRRRDINEECPLCDYVYDDDGFFDYNLIDFEDRETFTTYFLNVTTQVWLDESFSNQPVWSHHLTVHVPHGIREHENAAFLYPSYGSNDWDTPGISDGHIRQTGEICRRYGIITAVLRQVPNQPLVFTADPFQRSRIEDDLIAWTWRQFILDVNDTEVQEDTRMLARNPMCKAVVKAMDAMTLFVHDLDGTLLDDFMIAGESKRGWTTWIVGAIDARVTAMAPVVLSCLNMRDNLQHYYRSFGGWPYYMLPYWSSGCMGWLNEPELDALADVVDPYTYIEWMTIPVLMISGASDEFFLLDDSHYFFDDLPGEKHIWILDNTGHSISGSPHHDDYWNMLANFYDSVLKDQPRPEITWTRHTDETNQRGSIRVRVLDRDPVGIVAYWADSVVEDRRDWRLKMLNHSVASPPPDGSLPEEVNTNIRWNEETVTDLGNGQYEVIIDYPDQGFRAFFIKMRLPGHSDEDYHFTTEAHVIPDYFPYNKCTSFQECTGRLF